ncbi:MAG TPA: bifunctional diaminohydroxyphosphoribosylaminopyrimidine deaminase/5-amino-6-(5-phosphoribosylamino)uracil reductase RibD [Longimicrobiales bacterium]|nr:bifunctional diaminohydroxyphosphoribosylaminopyrimidine deaminase/5-amino-6-(5-phosphoribosylamino)uracil reductase RibD [Longimicrobiales bacterium]
MDVQDGIDVGFLHAALRLAEKGWGRVQPNPLVGAVIVVDKEIVGAGYHGEYGGPHAEVEALQAAGEQARGATLYVTLEPCAHYGKTPPCTDAIIAAGVKRVVYGARDPHHLAQGGAEVLRNAGIEVKGDMEAAFVRAQNAPFFKLHERGGCYVALKLAMSLDARLTRVRGEREQVTSDVANQEVHRLRSGFDGVMVGTNTARIDDPQLTVRLARAPIRPPARIIIDTHATLSPQSRLVQTLAEAPVVVICGETAETTALTSAGVGVITVPTEHDHVDLKQALEQLAAAGIYSVLCEGGATLGAALLEADLVERIYAFVAPEIFGQGGTPAFPLENPLIGGRFELQRIAKRGRDALLMLDRCLPD